MKWEIGDSAKRRLVITKMSNDIFGSLSGDRNPVHFSQSRMAKTRFKRPIANGIQVLSCIGSAIVELFTTDDTIPIAVEQHNSFLKPVFIGDAIEATVEVIPNQDSRDLRDDEYWLSCMVRNEDKQVVLSATFRIRVLDA